MNIDFTKTGENTARIELTIEPQDYLGPFESELKTYQKKVNLKGFRKGKTPKSVIRKMYGLPILSELITKQLQDRLFEYLEKEKIEILGQPISSESQEAVRFQVGDEVDYKFLFDLGLKPEFELPDLSEPFHYYDVVIADESIDSELEALQRRAGHHDHIKSDFEDGDLISFNAWELEDGDVKKDGLETEFQVMVDMMKDDFKAKVLEGQVGDTLDFNIFQVEEELSDDLVRLNLMNLEDEDEDRKVNPEFRGEIVDASREVLADLDEEFLTMAFGDEINTEEQAREFIREDLKMSYDNRANSIFDQKVYDKLTDETEIDLPAEFLKKWMLQSQNESDENQERITPEEVEKSYEEQFKDSLRWQLIVEKLAKKYEIDVSQDEVLGELGRRIQQYLPGQQLTNEVYNQVLHTMANNEDQVQQAFSQVRINKMFDALRKDLTLDKEEISQEDFRTSFKEWSEDQRQKDDEGSEMPEEEEVYAWVEEE